MNTETMICESVRLQRKWGYSKREMACCALPQGSYAELHKAFCAAPQFSKIDVDTLLDAGAERLRVLLIAEDLYYAEQVAAYLSAMAFGRQKQNEEYLYANSGWNDPEIDAFLDNAFPDETEIERCRRELTVVSPQLLDPELNEAEDERRYNINDSEKKKLHADRLSGDALLVMTDSGAALSETVVEELETLCRKRIPLFVALKRSQVDRVLIDELRLTLGFQTAQVGRATAAYLARVLREALDENGVRPAADMDLDAVVARMRSVRGTGFTECDLESIARRAPKTREVCTNDLLFETYRPAGRNRRSAMDELDAMIGMESVKNALRRQLASFVFESQRSADGFCAPAHRSLAFAGSPGTGKTVTARLIAEILREEGCGTGRFVEAGREQLIGKYVGHTSPKIAKLFESARGGVLFIDEAGALIPWDGRDTFTTEAISALVRHIENEPETVVIFATYGDAMKRLLAADQGLSSRIAQVLTFEDYSDDELMLILEKLARDSALALPDDARETCLTFFRKLRDRKGERFGNGREARRLLESAREELALRSLHTHGGDDMLCAEDFKTASERLLAQEDNKQRALPHVGFC